MKKLFIPLSFSLIASSAMAQTTPLTLLPMTGLSAINAIINNTASVTSATISGVTNMQAIGTELAVYANGLQIPISTTATIGLNGARLAEIASVGLRAANLLGVAAIVVPLVFDKLGLVICPAPNFVCKFPSGTPNSGMTPVATATSGSFTSNQYYDSNRLYLGATPLVVCIAMSGYGSTAASVTLTQNNASSWNCTYKNPNASGNITTLIYMSATGVSGPVVAAVDSDIQPNLQSALSGNAATQQNLSNAMRSAGLQQLQTTDPVTLVTPATVSSGASSISSQINNSDGSTSTQVIRQSSVVTPTQTGSTVSTVADSYPTVVTTTTTTTNNSTGAISTSTGTATVYPVSTTVGSTATVTTNPTTTVAAAAATAAAAAATPATPAISGFSLEATQQLLLQSLSGSGIPAASTVDSSTPLQTIANQNTTNSNFTPSITLSSLGIFSWIPTINTSVCVNPTVPNPVTGAMVSINICDAFNMFKAFISAVICFFALIGSVREVQSVLKD